MHSAAPPDAPGTWEAATEPVDMIDHSIELPELAPMPRHHAARIGRAALVLVLVLGCAGAAVAFSGVLEKRPDAAAPADAVGDASVVAPVRSHHAKAKPERKPVHRHRARRRHHRHAKVAPSQVVAAAPVPAASPAPIQTTASAPAPVRHVSSSPAPTSTPSRPTNSTTTTAPQPAASAPSGEPGRQPPSQP